jgi:hypothetical protein
MTMLILRFVCFLVTVTAFGRFADSGDAVTMLLAMGVPWIPKVVEI